MLKQKTLLAALVGGVVLFLWGFLTHAVLPLYNNSLNRFTNEEEVSRAIASNAARSGTYLAPNMPALPPNASAEEKENAMKEMQEKMKQGPVMFAHVRVGATSSFTGYYLVQIVIDLLAGFILTFILGNSKSTALRSRVLTAAAVGAAVIVLVSTPEWKLVWGRYRPCCC